MGSDKRYVFVFCTCRSLAYIPISKQNSMDLTLFIRIVSWDVWTSLVALMIITTVAWKITEHFSDTIEISSTKLFEASLFLLLQQGSELIPTKASSRIILLSIALFSVLFVEIYSCDLFASFAVTTFKLPFQDFSQLYNSEYRLGSLNIVWRSWFEVHDFYNSYELSLIE